MVNWRKKWTKTDYLLILVTFYAILLLSRAPFSIYILGSVIWIAEFYTNLLKDSDGKKN